MGLVLGSCGMRPLVNEHDERKYLFSSLLFLNLLRNVGLLALGGELRCHFIVVLFMVRALFTFTSYTTVVVSVEMTQFHLIIHHTLCQC